MLFQGLRSLVFYLLYLGQTAILAVIVGLIGIIWRRRTRVGWALVSYWGRSNLFFLRWVVGIRTQVLGRENIPHGPAIIAAKHMSDWDIFAIWPVSGRPAFIAKRELMDIPFFGHAARSFDAIKIDRSRGTEAIPAMLEEAGAALARGCRIIIFPEGTRRLPLADPDYRQGVVRMYQGLGVPVVPVALDSGLYWPRNSWILWPGTARARFLPAIMPGLEPAVFQQRLQSDIEAATEALILDAVAGGLSGPIAPGFAERIEAAQARTIGDGHAKPLDIDRKSERPHSY